jgi:hypothetical protein
MKIPVSRISRNVTVTRRLIVAAVRVFEVWNLVGL